MSFRSRLTLFFVLIVIVPMVSVAFVLFRLISDNETGKADARVAARQEVAINLENEARKRADLMAETVGKDPGLAVALRTDDNAKAQRRAQALAKRVGATRVVVAQGGEVLADAGVRTAIFPSSRALTGDDRMTTLQVASTDARSYAKLVAAATDSEVVVRSDGRVLAATLDGSGNANVPGPGDAADVEVGGRRYRAATFSAAGFDGQPVEVTVMQSTAGIASDVGQSRLLAAGILLGFFVLAFTFAVLVSRSLQNQIEGFLLAARRLGAGDFSAAVPTSGHDEFAALGDEFNKMSRQLETRLEELSRERVRLQLALRRVGETFASNLDRDALLEIVVRTAIDGVGADGGRASARADNGSSLREIARAGLGPNGSADAVHEAEQEVLQEGRPSEVSLGDSYALAHPLRAGAAVGGEGSQRVTGLVSVWRAGQPFSEGERELFTYLAGQVAVSIENVGLHEVVELQAVTDELTGLSNRRRFQETLTAEVERSKRFGQEVGLLMLDIDDFKAVNDTFGHQQGDQVLREVARILQESTRDIDEPARYGGEELAVVLPGTDLEGAYNLAERVREGIEALELEAPTGGGTIIRVTASLGVAAHPGSAEDSRGLVAAADAALYEAKRAGKNRTVRAG